MRTKDIEKQKLEKQEMNLVEMGEAVEMESKDVPLFINTAPTDMMNEDSELSSIPSSEESEGIKSEIESQTSAMSYEKAEMVEEEKAPAPSRMISLNNSSGKFNHLFNHRLGSTPEEFFEGAWCYKVDNRFTFTIGGEHFRKLSEKRQATGKRNGEGTECRLINFDDEFADWEFYDGYNVQRITGCHIRIDKNIPRDGDYHAFPAFHITLEFEDKSSLHFRFDENGVKKGKEWKGNYEVDNPTIMKAVLDMARDFVKQVDNRHAPAPRVAPKITHSPKMFPLKSPQDRERERREREKNYRNLPVGDRHHPSVKSDAKSSKYQDKNLYDRASYHTSEDHQSKRKENDIKSHRDGSYRRPGR